MSADVAGLSPNAHSTGTGETSRSNVMLRKAEVRQPGLPKKIAQNGHLLWQHGAVSAKCRTSRDLPMATPNPNCLPPPDAQAAACFLAGCLPPSLGPLLARIRQRQPAIARLGVLLIDSDGAHLGCWADSDGRVQHCPPAIASLPGNPALSRCGASGQPHPLPIYSDPALHWAAGDEYLPQLLLPIRRQHDFFGFLVLESHPGVRLSNHALHELLAWAPLAADLLAQSISEVGTLIGATRYALDLTLIRDRDTGEHQLRLRDYIRVLATELAAAHGLPERYVAELTLFGPLHDIGKVGVPDAILLKPGGFDALEWERMKEHVIMGRQMVERMTERLSLQHAAGVDTLHAVVAWHHECMDGSGYPDGLRGDQIPLAARIISTADIFDALTSVRPYKRPWQLEEAFGQLQRLAGSQLDRDCVQAMLAARRQVTAVWQQHAST
jgi:HD-GYP domain-containing protein (c-di-GMP phosphodiesterase class II)